MNERKRLILTAIAVSLLAVLTGLFVGGDLLPSQAADQQYAVRTTQTISKAVVTHSHDGLPPHQHVVTTVVTVTETASNGVFHDFEAAPAPGATLPSAPPEPASPGAEPPPVSPPVQPGGTTSPNTTASPPSSVRGPYDVWIIIKDMVPANLTIPVGTTVTWTNKDTYLHTVTSADGLFDAGLLPQETFKYTFTTAGVFPYFCQPHPEITGSVTVK